MSRVTNKANQHAEEYAKNVIEGRSFVVEAYLAGYTEASEELKKVNQFINDIAKLLGEPDLGFDGLTWSIDDFEAAIKALNAEAKYENQLLREALQSMVQYFEKKYSEPEKHAPYRKAVNALDECSPISASPTTESEAIKVLKELDDKNCGQCGGIMVEIRGRYPGQSRRKICPTCVMEKLEDMSSSNQICKENKEV